MSGSRTGMFLVPRGQRSLNPWYPPRAEIMTWSLESRVPLTLSLKSSFWWVLIPYGDVWAKITIQNLIQHFHPSFNPWSMIEEFPSDKAPLKNQGKDSCHAAILPSIYTSSAATAAILPSIYTSSALSQDTFTMTRWLPQVTSGPFGSQDGSEFRTV